MRAHADALRKAKKRVVIAGWTQGSRERLETILRDHELAPLAGAETGQKPLGRPPDIVSTIVLGMEEGFETDTLAIIAEQDILGDRLIRRDRKSRKASDVLSELTALTPGDLVVHVDHGIGRFEGLKTIEVQGAPHDCLFIMYAGNDRLFLPVENIELLTRYGSDEAGRPARQAWRRRLAGAQGQAQAAHQGHGGAAHQDGGGARIAGRRGAAAARWRV